MTGHDLAAMIGVSDGDLNSLMRMVCQSISKDGMGDILLLMSESERVETVQAYTCSEVRKFSDFCLTLLTNEEKSGAFNLYLFKQFSS